VVTLDRPPPYTYDNVLRDGTLGFAHDLAIDPRTLRQAERSVNITAGHHGTARHPLQVR